MKKAIKYTGIGLLAAGATYGTIKVVKNWENIKAYYKNMWNKGNGTGTGENEIELPPAPRPKPQPAPDQKKNDAPKVEPESEPQGDYSQPIIRREILEGKEKI